MATSVQHRYCRLTDNNRWSKGERRHVTQLWSCFLLLAIFSKLVTKITFGKLIDANICCNSTRDHIMLTKENKTFNVIRLSSEKRKKNPLFILAISLDWDNTSIYACCIDNIILCVDFNRIDISFQMVESLNQSSMLYIPCRKFTFWIPWENGVLLEKL